MSDQSIPGLIHSLQVGHCTTTRSKSTCKVGQRYFVWSREQRFEGTQLGGFEYCTKNDFMKTKLKKQMAYLIAIVILPFKNHVVTYAFTTAMLA